MSLKLVNYSEKAIAVFGDVDKYHSALVSLGGMFNARLTEKDSGERKPGFIFSKFAHKTVAAFVANPKEEVESKRQVKDKSSDEEDKIMLSREQFMNLVSQVTRLEQDVAMLKKKLDISSTPSNVSVIKVPAEKTSTRTPVKNTKETKEQPSWADEGEDYVDEDEENEESEEEKKGPSLLLQKKPTQSSQTLNNKPGFKSLLMPKK